MIELAVVFIAEAALASYLIFWWDRLANRKEKLDRYGDSLSRWDLNLKVVNVALDGYFKWARRLADESPRLAVLIAEMEEDYKEVEGKEKAE